MGANQLAELRLEVLLLVRREIDTAIAGAVQPVGQALLDGPGRKGADRVQRCRVQVSLLGCQREVGPDRGGKDARRPRGLRAGEQRAAADRESACTSEKVATAEDHGASLIVRGRLYAESPSRSRPS
jgi:hypothetical protein